MNSSTLAFGVVIVALVIFAAVVLLGFGSLLGNLHLPAGIVR